MFFKIIINLIMHSIVATRIDNTEDTAVASAVSLYHNAGSYQRSFHSYRECEQRSKNEWNNGPQSCNAHLSLVECGRGKSRSRSISIFNVRSARTNLRRGYKTSLLVVCSRIPAVVIDSGDPCCTNSVAPSLHSILLVVSPIGLVCVCAGPTRCCV
jgi:hypothetical protein